MTLTDFFQSIRDQHAEEVARGEHDIKCEVRTNRHICHCSKRRRIAAGFIASPGPLIFPLPICPRCDQDVDGDSDGWWCDTCSVSWSRRDHDPGEFSDDYGDLEAEPASGTPTVEDQS